MSINNMFFVPPISSTHPSGFSLSFCLVGGFSKMFSPNLPQQLEGGQYVVGAVIFCYFFKWNLFYQIMTCFWEISVAINDINFVGLKFIIFTHWTETDNLKNFALHGKFLILFHIMIYFWKCYTRQLFISFLFQELMELIECPQ